MVRLTPPAGSSSSTRRGPGHERHRGVEQLLLAVAEAAGLLVGQVPEPEEGDHAIGLGRVSPASRGAEQAAKREPSCSCPARMRFSRTVSCGKHLQQLEGAADAEPVELARGACR